MNLSHIFQDLGCVLLNWDIFCEVIKMSGYRKYITIIFHLSLLFSIRKSLGLFISKVCYKYSGQVCMTPKYTEYPRRSILLYLCLYLIIRDILLVIKKN